MYKIEVILFMFIINVFFFYEKEFKFKGYYKVVVVYFYKRVCLFNYNVIKYVLGEIFKFFVSLFLLRF